MSLPDAGIWVNCSNSPSKIGIITPITKAPVKNRIFLMVGKVFCKLSETIDEIEVQLPKDLTK